MAVKKIQKNRLNDSGEYDVIHYETEAGIVKTADGGDVETKLTEKLAKSGGEMTGDITIRGAKISGDFEGGFDHVKIEHPGTNAYIQVGEDADFGSVVISGDIDIAPNDNDRVTVGSLGSGITNMSDGGQRRTILTGQVEIGGEIGAGAEAISLPGTLKVPRPEEENDAVPKLYVDDFIDAVSVQFNTLPIKTLIGTPSAPINLDNLRDPGIYYITGTQTTTVTGAANGGLLDNEVISHPLFVSYHDTNLVQCRVSDIGDFRARRLLGSLWIKMPFSRFVMATQSYISADKLRITELAEPEEDADAATKGYVDETTRPSTWKPTPSDIVREGYTAAGLDPIAAAMIGSAASNKSFGLPAEAITIEYSNDGGATWEDYGASDTAKIGLLSELRSTPFYLGKRSSTVTANPANAQTTDSMLRVTIRPTDRYVTFNSMYCWFRDSSNTCEAKIECSTIGAKDTFAAVRDWTPVSGWSGNNIMYFPKKAFGGTESQPNNQYAYRITFRNVSVSADGRAIVNDIRFYGVDVHSTVPPNNMVAYNHLYRWDTLLNAIFEKSVSGEQLISRAAEGAPPLVVGSTTAVPKLNADLLDGKHADDFAENGHTHTAADVGALPLAGGAMTGDITMRSCSISGNFGDASESIALKSGQSMVKVGDDPDGADVLLKGKTIVLNPDDTVMIGHPSEMFPDGSGILIDSTGVSMTGTVTVDDPTEKAGVANKGYVDNKVDTHAKDTTKHITAAERTTWNGKESAIKNAAAKTTLADADTLPLSDSAASSATKKITWANLIAAIKTKLNSVYAAASHSHAWSAITGKPTSMTPTAHKDSHKTGGSDALTAADIGALPKSGGRVDGWFGVIPGEYTEKLYVCQDGVFVGDGSYQDEREAPFQLPFLSGRPRIPSPVIPTEAANKAYVDAETAKCLPLAGGTMTGDLNLEFNEIHLAYGTRIFTSGDIEDLCIMANSEIRFYDKNWGKASFSNVRRIYGLEAPTGADQAANKAYVDEKQLVFAGKTVAVSAWAANTTYSAQGYGFRAAVACAGVTASHRPDVAFGAADAVSGNFAPFSESYAGGVYIYCKTKPTATVTIPSIVCIKGA